MMLPRAAQLLSASLPFQARAKWGSIRQGHHDRKPYFFGVDPMEPTKRAWGEVLAIVPAQWGNEGTGKLVDFLGTTSHLCNRVSGGPNAGHHVRLHGVDFDFHSLPAGILNPKTSCLIGHGCVLSVPTLLRELKLLEEHHVDYKKRLKISDRTHLLFAAHQQVDRSLEQHRGAPLGSTLRGVGPAYSSKALRVGVRVCDLYTKEFPDLVHTLHQTLLKDQYNAATVDAEVHRYQKIFGPVLKPLICDGIDYTHSCINRGMSVVLQGGGAAMLDVDDGTYPFCMANNSSLGALLASAGVGPGLVTDVVGVVKAYTTRVGTGPFPTELKCAVGDAIRTAGHEYSTSMDRARRCGWLDLVQVQYAHQLNAFNSICLSKLYGLNALDEIKVAVDYKLDGRSIAEYPSCAEDLDRVEVVYETIPGWKCDVSEARRFGELPLGARNLIELVQDFVGVQVRWVGVGRERIEMAAQSRAALDPAPPAWLDSVRTSLI